MEISHCRNPRIMILARINLCLAIKDQEEINLYERYQKKIYSEQNQEEQ